MASMASATTSTGFSTSIGGTVARGAHRGGDGIGGGSRGMTSGRYGGGGVILDSLPLSGSING